uniref:hypothetical protein n=1 Tax=Bacteroides uniformis TaxID=820 RepID=UPI0040278826
MRVKFYQIYQDLELEEKIISARTIVNRYLGKDETVKTLYNVFKEYNDNLETRMKRGRKINCVMLYFPFKLIGRGSASAKGVHQHSRRA